MYIIYCCDSFATLLYSLNMQLTSFTDYALRTLMYLAARPDEKSSVKQVSEHYGISYNHLVKMKELKSEDEFGG